MSGTGAIVVDNGVGAGSGAGEVSVDWVQVIMRLLGGMQQHHQTHMESVQCQTSVLHTHPLVGFVRLLLSNSLTPRRASGMALFLFGMSNLGKCLREAFGASLKQVLAKFCVNRFAGFATGTVATALLSSSTAAR